MHTIQNAHLFRHSVVWRFVLKVPYAQKRKKLSHARITCSQSCKSPGSKAKSTTVAKEGLRIHEKGVVKAVQCCQNCLPDMDRWLRKKAGNQPHGNHTPSMRVQWYQKVLEHTENTWNKNFSSIVISIASFWELGLCEGTTFRVWVYEDLWGVMYHIMAKSKKLFLRYFCEGLPQRTWLTITCVILDNWYHNLIIIRSIL